MSNTSTSIVATMGIDIGKTSFHVVGLDGRGALVLRQKWSRGTGWQKAGITSATVTAVVVKGLVDKDASGHLALRDSGRAVLRTMLPDI
jgi:hypothetical protein